MQGQMMDYQLTLTPILERARRMFSNKEIVTKAGPTTVAEALARELPTILSGFIPSQEEENVTYMVNAGAGVLVEEPDRIVARLRS